jgi:1-acyl-sn-glycerol-3-phosphate acyltransferase
MGTLKKGAFKLAMDLGLPLLPITIIGTNNILPTGTIDLKPGKVSMVIHKPIDIKLYGEDQIKLLMDEAKEIISKPLHANN